jgi:ferredoxin
LEISGHDRLICVRHRFHSASCRTCADACPIGCLALTRGPQIDPRDCTDCGLCAAACPVQALPGATREVPDAAERLSGVKQAVLGCRSSSEGISTVRVACLGGFSALDLVVLASSVRGGALRLNLVSCRLCPAGAYVVPSVQRRVEEAAGVVGENRIDTLADTRVAGMTPRQAMRRGFLRNIVAPFAEVAHGVSSIQRGRAESVSVPAGIPERQNHVLRRHGILPESSTIWRLVKTPRCDDCCRCAGVCPTGALTRRHRDGRRVFGIATDRCTGCRACLDFCSKDGLQLSRAPGSRRPVSLPALSAALTRR